MMSLANGQVIYVENLPLLGHPGRVCALFPTGGLPAWIHSSSWNLRAVQAGAVHNGIHQSMRAAERVAVLAVNPVMTSGRIAANGGTCR